MNWWQRIVCFVFWPIVFTGLCGVILVAGFLIWLGIPFGFDFDWLEDEE